MGRYRFGAVLAIVLVAVGCMRVDTQMLDHSTAVISTRGAGVHTTADVLKSTLLAASEAVLSHGYRYFTVVGVQDATRTGTVVVPGRTFTTGTVTGTASGYGNQATYNGSYSGSTFTTPGQVTTVIRPGADVVIKMFHVGEIDPNQQGVWDAKSVAKSGEQPKEK